MSNSKSKHKFNNKWDIISGILGILGFIISVINIVIFVNARAKNLTVNFENYKVNEGILNDDALLYVEYRFDNNSELPLSITKVNLYMGEKYIDSIKNPIIISKTRSTISGDEYEDLVTTNTTPINLAILESNSGILAFQISNDIDISSDLKSLTFKIYTNRGKPIEKTFILGEDTKCY